MLQRLGSICGSIEAPQLVARQVLFDGRKSFAYYRGRVPAASLPANLLALPAVAPAMWVGMVKAALGVLGAALPGAAALAGALGPLAAFPVGMLAWLAGRFADAPLAAVGLPLGSSASVVVMPR